ncbi:hypothetical protein O3W44_21765 [Pantoea sp. LMR881]|nr:hypothetical protein [Pantoea sp. LMR881]MCZ4061161.1 hypothetical protein [Pantoea sp. LMR881]
MGLYLSQRRSLHTAIVWTFDTETFIVHQLPQLTLRRLMPVEYERLQGFPVGHTLIPWRGKDARLCPDAPRMKSRWQQHGPCRLCDG